MPINNGKDSKKIDGILSLTELKEIPEKAYKEPYPVISYLYCYTTGPFLLPENSGSLDWMLLNNDNSQQKARVTVFKCPVGTTKSPVAPGALVVTIDPGECIHNANEYTEGFAYEVQVECTSQLVFPYVSVWPGNFGVVIPGADINSGMFIKKMP
jgi:hypothetical protein